METLLKVRDLMSGAPISIRAGASLREADEAMQRAYVRHLPVVDDQGVLVAILSRSDLSVAIALEKAVEGVRMHWHVRDVAKGPVRTVHPDAPAHEAAATLEWNRIGSLPVVDEAGRIVGMLTAIDFLDVARRALVGLPPAAEPRRPAASHA